MTTSHPWCWQTTRHDTQGDFMSHEEMLTLGRSIETGPVTPARPQQGTAHWQRTQKALHNVRGSLTSLGMQGVFIPESCQLYENGWGRQTCPFKSRFQRAHEADAPLCFLQEAHTRTRVIWSCAVGAGDTAQVNLKGSCCLSHRPRGQTTNWTDNDSSAAGCHRTIGNLPATSGLYMGTSGG